MSLKSDPDMGINSWLEDELYQQYRHDRTAVDDEWKRLFDSNGEPKPANGAAPTAPTASAASRPAAPEAPASGELQPLRGVAGKIAENMAGVADDSARDLAADHRRQGDG